MKQYGAWAAALGLALAVTSGAVSAPKGSPTNDVVALVNDEPITREALVKRLLAYYGDQTLDAMINQLIVRQAAQRYKLVVTDADVDKRVVQIKGMFRTPELYLQMLRESGMTVMGFGEKKTPRAFVGACDKFVYTEILVTADDSTETTSTASVSRKSGKELRSDSSLGKLLRAAVMSSADEDGWCYVGRIGSYIANQAPDFDPRNYGYSKLSQLLAATEVFETQSRATKSGQAQKYLRPIQSKKPVKPKGRADEA